MEANPDDKVSFDSTSNSRAFAGYQWTYFASLQHGPVRSRAERFLESVNWPGLLDYATKKHSGVNCVLLPDIGLGYNHMVRIIEFADGNRWVARLRMPPLSDTVSKIALETKTRCEFATILLLQQRTSIPMPKVHAIEARDQCEVKASFMLMDCMEGNVGMDLGMRVPANYKKAFFRALASIHVQLSTVRLPQIGKVVSVNPDGTYEQGPIPGLGGPFDTATEFFRAWAAAARFGLTNDRLRDACGEYADEILASVSSFPVSIAALADKLSTHNHGPFPICHGDFGHNNIIVDDDYDVLGVIYWEMAFAGPWEVFGDFPLTLSVVPPAMDAQWNYDESGRPKDTELVQQFADQDDYIVAVRQEEASIGLKDHHLSEALEDSKRQRLMTAMRLYADGKAGWYSKVVDDFISS